MGIASFPNITMIDIGQRFSLTFGDAALYHGHPSAWEGEHVEERTHAERSEHLMKKSHRRKNRTGKTARDRAAFLAGQSNYAPLSGDGMYESTYRQLSRCGRRVTCR